MGTVPSTSSALVLLNARITDPEELHKVGSKQTNRSGGQLDKRKALLNARIADPEEPHKVGAKQTN